MKYVYSIYAWLIGGIFFVLILCTGILLSYILPGRAFHRPVQWLFKFLFRLLFIRVKVCGKNNIPQAAVVLYMSNHTSIFDLPLLAAFVPGYFRGIESDNQFSWPLWGFAIKRYGSIPINRASVQSSIATMRYAQKVLAEGTSIAILPEGHLSLDGKMQAFKKLPFVLAKESEVSIVPIGITGLYRVKKKGSWLIRPSKVCISFGESINRETINRYTVSELRNHTRAIIQDLAGEIR
jgi:1-acyl-sn-glycerol-3-phosphate acyltransferase